MKIEKNKLVFGSVVLVIILFITAYTIILMDNSTDENEFLQQTQVPRLKQEQKDYSSKLDAIDDIKEIRQTNAPIMYNEKFLDSTGLYDPELLDKEKERMIDSIYRHGRIDYSENTYRNSGTKKDRAVHTKKEITIQTEIQETISSKELGLEHQLFFASSPKPLATSHKTMTSPIYAEVDGNQVVKTNSRLQLRLLEDVQFGITMIPKNTLVYGVVSFQPNRTLIKIENINHMPVKLKAYDLQDGLEGIYVENSFRGEAANEVMNDMLDDINIAGVPQVRGIKKVFQRNNRSVKVSVSNNYKLILKPL